MSGFDVERFIAASLTLAAAAALYAFRSSEFGRTLIRCLRPTGTIIAFSLVFGAAGAVVEWLYLVTHWFESPPLSLAAVGAAIGAGVGTAVIGVRLLPIGK